MILYVVTLTLLLIHDAKAYKVDLLYLKADGSLRRDQTLIHY